MNNITKSVAIDMDGVIADVETHVINWYERDHGLRMTREQMNGLPEFSGFPKKEVPWTYIRSAGFFSTVPPMEGAVEAVKKIMEHFTVYIVSAAMEFPLSLPEKHAWLQEHFPFISWRNIVFCGDKSIINTDYMIDDHPKNLDFFKGKAIIFTASHNVNHSHHQRANNWQEVLAILGMQ